MTDRLLVRLRSREARIGVIDLGHVGCREIEETLERLGESLWAAGPLDGVLRS